MKDGPATILIEKPAVKLPPTLSLSLMLNVAEPAAAGVPDNVPEVDNDSPAGKEPDTTCQL
jgi:hypothetical protein